MFDTEIMGAAEPGIHPLEGGESETPRPASVERVSATSVSLRAVAARAGGGTAGLEVVADRVAPLVMAGDRRLEVSPALAHVLPDGLQRGSTVGVRGSAALSLGLTVAAGPVAMGSWLATLGCDELGLVGAEQAGIALHRMVMVTQPPRSSWGSVAAALVDAFDVVMIASPHPIPGRDGRRLLSRVRERGGVIIDVAGTWPEAHDLVLDIRRPLWRGLGVGHGVLHARQVTVEVAGRRGVRPRSVPLWLPGPSGAPESVEPGAIESDAGSHAGSDIASLERVDHQRPAVATPLRTAG